MKFTLKNGKVVDIEEFTAKSKVTARQFLDYFAPIIREKPEPFLRYDKPPSLQEEKKWLNEARKSAKKGTKVRLLVWSNGKIIGSTEAGLGTGRDRDKASIGISIAKEYRGLGLGTKLLIEIVKLTKKKLKPKIIFLTVIAGNKNAKKLYEKVGFREIAVLPKWQKVRGKYWDYIYMRYKPRG